MAITYFSQNRPEQPDNKVINGSSEIVNDFVWMDDRKKTMGDIVKGKKITSGNKRQEVVENHSMNYDHPCPEKHGT